MAVKKLNDKEMPELYIDGEKVKFHYNRQERLSMINKSNIKNPSFFSKRFRYMHIIIIDLVIIAIIGAIFSFAVGRSKSIIINDFKFYFSKPIISNSPNIDFKMQVKNILPAKNTLKEEYRNMNFNVFDNNDNLIFSKNFFVEQKIYNKKDYFTEYLIIKKPEKKGNYYAVINFGENYKKQLRLNFTIK